MAVRYPDLTGSASTRDSPILPNRGPAAQNSNCDRLARLHDTEVRSTKEMDQMNVLLLEDRLTASTGKGVAYVYNRGIGNSTAGCSCGWIGRRRLLKAAAEQDAWSHCAYLGCGVSVPLVFPDRG